jgi:hypothetical protein
VLRLGFTFVLTTECCHLGMRCDAIFAGVYLPMPNLPSLVKVWEEIRHGSGGRRSPNARHACLDQRDFDVSVRLTVPCRSGWQALPEEGNPPFVSLRNLKASLRHRGRESRLSRVWRERS